MLHTQELTGKVAVVTGAGQGIGREAALALARAGARIVVADIAESGRETAELIAAAGGTAAFYPTDVSSEAGVAKLAMWTLADFGPASLLINNAIVSPVAPVLDLTPEQFDRTLAVNLRGAYLTCRTFLPGMLELKGGTIINMVSTDAMAYMSAYIASKQGLAGFSQSLAAEVGHLGVHVVAFAPGFVDTPGLKEAGRQLAPRLGMTAEAFAALSFHPAYAGMMPAADAGLATALLAARYASDYHGEVVTGYTVLERAGLIAPSAAPAGAALETEAPPAGPGEALQEALDYSRRLQTIIGDTEAEFGRLPIFVRPLARNGFKSKAGQGLADWARMAAALTVRLEAAETDPSGLVALAADVPRLAGLLEQLITYCQGVPGETARFTRDQAMLKQVAETMAAREESLRSLIGVLKRLG